MTDKGMTLQDVIDARRMAADLLGELDAEIAKRKARGERHGPAQPIPVPIRPPQTRASTARGGHEMTPYQRGYDDRLSGRAGPSRTPNGNATWAEKLYYRGWMDALAVVNNRRNDRKC